MQMTQITVLRHHTHQIALPFWLFDGLLSKYPQGTGNYWFFFPCIYIVKGRALTYAMPKWLENIFPLTAQKWGHDFLQSMIHGMSTAFSLSYHTVSQEQMLPLSISLWSFPWLCPAILLRYGTGAGLEALERLRLLQRQLSCSPRASISHMARFPTLPPWNTEGLLQVWPAAQLWDSRALQGSASSQCDLRLKVDP